MNRTRWKDLPDSLKEHIIKRDAEGQKLLERARWKRLARERRERERYAPKKGSTDRT